MHHRVAFVATTSIAEILGVAGFVLALVALYLERRDYWPRLRCGIRIAPAAHVPGVGVIFGKKVTGEAIVRLDAINESRRAVIIDKVFIALRGGKHYFLAECRPNKPLPCSLAPDDHLVVTISAAALARDLTNVGRRQVRIRAAFGDAVGRMWRSRYIDFDLDAPSTPR